MVKKYLTACAALLMLATASVDAQTLYAGIGRISPSSWGETNGTEGRIVSFDLSDPSTFTGEFCRDVIGEGEMFTAGATAGNTYYGILFNEDKYIRRFCAFNFETNEMSVISESGANLVSMAYDEASQTLYGLRGGAAIVTVDMATGATTNFMSTGAAWLGAIASDGEGGLWGIAAYSTPNPPSTPVQLWHIDLASRTIEEVGVTEDVIVGAGISAATIHSAVYEDGLIYIVGDRQLVSLDPETLALTQIGQLPLNSLKGITFTMSTALAPGSGSVDPEPEPSDGTTAYAGTGYITSSWAAENGYQGRIVTFDVNDPSTFTGEPLVIPTVDQGDGVLENYLLKAGATVGNTYYAILEGDFFSPATFESLNFETGEMQSVGSGDTQVTDMAYLASTGTLYGVKENYSTLVTISTEDGSAADYFEFDHPVSVVAASADMLYLAGINAGQMTLYSFNPTTQEEVMLGELGAAPNYGLSAGTMSTMAYNEADGLLYMIAERIFYRINPVNAAVEQLGTLPLRVLEGLTFTASTELAGGNDNPDPEPEPEPDNGMHTSVVYTYGDVMGTISPDQVGQKRVYYYDAENKLVREGVYGAAYTTSGSVAGFALMSYVTYLYNDQGQLVSQSSEQVGMYDGIYNILEARNDTVRYEYDDQGRLSKEIDVSGNFYTEYQYDDEGQLVYKARMYPNTDGTYYVMESHEYSDFVGFDKPQLDLGDGRYESYKTTARISYDENGNKVRTETWNADESTLQTIETWTYDAETGILTEYIKHGAQQDENGEWVEKPSMTKSARTTYAIENEDPNRIRQRNYEWNTGTSEWVEKIVNTLTVTSYFDAMYSPELTVEPIDGEINSYRLTFNLPNVPAIGGGMAFDIIRDGEIIKRIETTDPEVDLETGTVTYDDMYVMNGEYDYMVQSILYSELMEYETPYNVSNVVVESPYVELPAVTNVGTVEWDDVDRVLSLIWDAPADLDEALQFQSYEVWDVAHYSIPDNVTGDSNGMGLDTLTNTTYDMTVMSGYESVDITVRSCYTFGRVFSDTLHVDLVNFVPTRPNGIADAQEQAAAKVQVDGDELVVLGDAAKSVAVYSVNGVLELRAENAERVSIAGLQEGIHLAVVTVADDKIVVVKFVKE